MELISFIALFILFSTLWVSCHQLIKLCDSENKVDWGSKVLNRIDGLTRLFCHRYHGMPREYVDLPEHGAAIVVGNHISGLDPLLMAVACKRPVRFLVAKEEYQRFGLKWMFKAAGCIPVDRKSNPELAMHEALAVLNQGEVVGIFPHGGIQWPTNLTNKIKGGAVRLAQRCQCSIYPIFFSGIGLKGFTIPSLVVRSRVKTQYYPAMRCGNTEYDNCMNLLAQILNQKPDATDIEKQQDTN